MNISFSRLLLSLSLSLSLSHSLYLSHSLFTSNGVYIEKLSTAVLTKRFLFLGGQQCAMACEYLQVDRAAQAGWIPSSTQRALASAPLATGDPLEVNTHKRERKLFFLNVCL